jgi:hypothetical protein
MLRSIFAMELCFPFDQGLHAVLRAHVRNQPAAMGYQDKWSLYRAAREDLAAGLSRVERGCWDYFDDDARAQNDYRMWVNGMLTDETARTSPAGPPDPYRGGPRYMTFTMAFLIQQDTPTDQAMANLCNIPEQRLWERQTFARILGGLGVLNFASVQSDVLYLIPRDDDWALTSEDMSHPKFQYLRPLY